MVKRTILLAVIGALAAGLTLLPATSEAQVAKILRLQGRLLSQAGTPIPDGDYGVTLRFYKQKADAKADALLVYIDPGVKVGNGLFAISIGETTKLDPKSFEAGDAAWLGLQVGSDEEMPRIALHYVAYALRADMAADLACSGCVSAEELDPKVLEPYAKTESLHKVATSGKYEDVEGTPDLTPYAKSDDLHKVAKTGKYDALEGLPPLADLKACASGEVLQGFKPDGVAVCVKDADTQYTGKDFALSNLKCGAGEVVHGIGIDGKPLCVKDANDKYDGKTFALSAQACPKGEVSTGTAADGKPVCVKDADTQYTGKDFALSDKKCDPNKVVAGFTADGAPICVLDQKGESTGKDFALSNQKCADGQVSKGVDIDGKPICVADADTKYTGKDFALSNQTCPTGQVLNGISAAGKMLCVADKDNDTKYSGKNFAVSNQTCAADQKLVGVDGEGVKICASDADTKYSGKDFALSNQKCATGQVLTGIDGNGYKLCTAVGGTSHNHNYDVNDAWLRENGQNAPFKAHGGKQQLVMRTDGAAEYATGIGAYPFVWMYGGDVVANRIMALATDGNIWTKTYGWLHTRFAAANKTCPKGQVMAGVKSDGDPLCVTDQNTPTIYKAGTGLALAGDTFSLNLTYADGRYVNAGEANAITSAMIKDGQVTGADVADSSLTGSDILNSSLTGSDVKDGSIASADITDNSLTGADVLDGSLTGSDVKDSSLSGSDILNESLTGSDIKNGTISGSDILNESVTSADIDDGTLKYTDTDVNSIQRRVASSCPAGSSIRVINSNGTVTCQVEGNLNITTVAGWAQRAASSAGWTSTTGWGEPAFTNSAAYTATDLVTKAGSETIDFNIPSGAKTAYMSMLSWNNTGYFDIYLKYGSYWKFHRRIDQTQAVSNNSSGTHDGNIVVVAATGLNHFSQIRIQNRKGRIHFSGFGFSPEDMVGAGGSGFVNWDNVVSKPNVAYEAKIPADNFTQTEVNNLRAAKLDNGTTPWVMAADDFTQTEVNNLRAAKLDNGTTPWVMAADDFTQTEVNNLRAAKLDNGTTPWTSGTSHNHTYNVNDAWLRDNGDNANFKVYGNTRQVAFRTDGTAAYASGVGGYPFAWMYGGDASTNALMYLHTNGDIWTKSYGWLHSKFSAATHNHDTAYVKKAGDTMTGQLNNYAGGGGTMLLYRNDTYVYSGDMLGGIGFDSNDGALPTSIPQASASILAFADETQSTGDKGGRLEFWTSEQNQDQLTNGIKRMSIDSYGTVTHYEDSLFGDAYDDRTRVASWRVYDNANQNDSHYLDRYQVVLTYNSYYKNTKALDMARIGQYCDDYDGCQVILGMIDWYSSGYHYEMAHYSFRFHYDAGTGRWRIADGGPGGGTSGVDGDSSEAHILNAYDACYFSEHQYISGTAQNDGTKQLYMLYWTAYATTTYKNKKCVITFMD